MAVWMSEWWIVVAVVLYVLCLHVDDWLGRLLCSGRQRFLLLGCWCAEWHNVLPLSSCVLMRRQEGCVMR